MHCAEHTLTLKIIKTPCAQIKFFIMFFPVPVASFYMRQLYQAHDLTNDELNHDILRVFKRDYTSALKHLLNKLKRIHDVVYSEVSIDEVVVQTLVVFAKIREELALFGIDIEQPVNFNTVWLDTPDTLTFCRMDLSDVSSSSPTPGGQY